MHRSLPALLAPLLLVPAACGAGEDGGEAGGNGVVAAPEAPLVARVDPIERPDPGQPPLRPVGEAPPGPGPRLVAAEATHDFGSVYAGAIVPHTFVLEVAGTEPLTISKIKPGCGCTAADPRVVTDEGREPYELETPLAPGTRLELDVALDTQNTRGPQAKSINVYCNDPRGVQRLVMAGRVEPFLNTVPDRVSFGRLSVVESRTAEAVVTTRDGEPLLLSVDSTRLPPTLAVELAPDDPDGEGRSSSWKVSLTFGGEDLREGPFQFRVPIVSDVANPHPGPERKEHRAFLGTVVWVQAQVVGLYSVQPRQMFFGPVAADTALARAVRITDATGREAPPAPRVRLLDGRGQPLEDERYRVSVEPLGEVPGWSLELQIDGLPAGHGIFEGTLVLETENPDRPEVEVAFKGVVR